MFKKNLAELACVSRDVEKLKSLYTMYTIGRMENDVGASENPVGALSNSQTRATVTL